MTPTSPDCCELWPSIRIHLKWFQVQNQPGVYVMPTIPRTMIRVNHCPSCGEERRFCVWNTNTDSNPLIEN